MLNGNRTCFQEFVSTVRPTMQRYALKLLQNQGDAEDATQEALLKVFTRIMDYNPTKDALPWILAITHFECLTIRKRIARKGEVPFEPQAHEQNLGESQDVLAELLRKESQAAIEDIFADLRPEDQQTIFIKLNGEIADGVSPATFRKRWQRAMYRLTTLWRTKYGQ